MHLAGGGQGAGVSTSQATFELSLRKLMAIMLNLSLSEVIASCIRDESKQGLGEPRDTEDAV